MNTSQSGSDDELVFLDEPVDGGGSDCEPSNVWRVMIIDDDVDVHSATTFSLRSLKVQGRPLQFLHAYSAAEARRLMANEQDIAVILLDVVMEQETAGLQLVRHIRNDLGMSEVRIILRTGQPGYAPEIDAIRDYDINDYKTKSELTQNKLYTAVTTAIRSYEQIRAINASRRGLDLIVRASTELMALQGLQNFAAGVITQIAGLLGIQPEGLLCVRESGEVGRSELFVIAAAGRYRDAINKPVSTLGNPVITEALTLALERRGNVYAPRHTALYFLGRQRRHFSAFVSLGTPLSDTDRGLLEVFCSNISVGLENVLLMSRLKDYAFYDQLTQLPNRTRLVQVLDEALQARGTDRVLALVDIDHFSATKETLGHKFGDMLVLAVAARLQMEAGERFNVARVGPDIFGLVGAGADVNPEAIQSYFHTPFLIEGQNVPLSVTLGLVRLQDHEGTGNDALKDGDIALKHAKMRRRSGHCYFSLDMAVNIRERVRMMYALRASFEARRLFVVYQPQIDLRTRQCVGAEALLRWRTEDGSYVPPDQFIPIAESCGLIMDIGAWVLQEACTELVRLMHMGWDDFKMSVNVSQAQFRHPGFLDMLNQTLKCTQAPPPQVELEITESMAMEDPAALIRLLAGVKRTGVTIAIDDFGTGFSSLSYLQQLQVDRLKIDRSFVSEITESSRGSSIAEMVIQLGRNLGLAVIAEGVEDERQARVLKAHGCPQAQGYLFAKGMPAQDLAAWLQQQRRFPVAPAA